MNIFDIYKENIIKILKDLNKKNIIKLPENFNSINVDVPPEKFSCDLSTNVAMVISKLNHKKIVDVVTGSLVLFPGSLTHYTIPFKSNKERIVLAFDVKPK